MTGALLDSNVLLDLLTDDPVWASWAAEALQQCIDHGAVYINPIIYAEVSVGFATIEELEAAPPATTFRRLPLPPAAAFLAGKAFSAIVAVGATLLDASRLLHRCPRGGHWPHPAHAGCPSLPHLHSDREPRRAGWNMSAEG
jgi:hypothetical protein